MSSVVIWHLGAVHVTIPTPRVVSGRRHLLLRCVVLAAIASSCVEAPDLEGRACSSADPCPEPLLCGPNQTCHAPCEVAADCVRDRDLCVRGLCTAGGGGLCVKDQDCSGDEVCRGGICGAPTEPTCTTSGECTSPASCELAEGAACVGGRCIYPRLACDAPPGYASIDADSTFRTFPSVGLCEMATGECRYPPTDLPCPACAQNCLSACAGVSCTETRGGCLSNGHCDPSAPDMCGYDVATDGTSCQQPGGASGQCVDGQCGGCAVDADCGDGSPCTRDTCNLTTHLCEYAPVAGACDDGSSCTTNDACMNGVCMGTPSGSCNSPPGECFEAIGTCTPTGCRYAPLPAQVACTDDGNPCTQDLCDGGGACTHPSVANGVACSDANACTQSDACQNGQCLGTSPVICSTPPGICYRGPGVCDPATGLCQYPPAAAGTSCSDADLCTYSDRCDGAGNCAGTSITCVDSAGVCGADRDCNGSNQCTVTYPGAGTSCNDGNACSHSDRCSGGGSCVGTVYSCNDNNACTSDTCNGNGGCTHARIAPSGLAPSGGQNVSTQSVTLTWTSCPGTTQYEVEIQFFGADNVWRAYFTYVETVANKTFFPCSSASPGAPCNSDFRFRVRASNGTYGPFSPWAVWHWSNCRAC